MALADSEIARRIHYEDDLDISPYNEDNLQPASYDLRLGEGFKALRRPSRWQIIKQGILRRVPFSTAERAHIDPHAGQTTETTVRVRDGEPFILGPQEFVLAHTREVVKVPDDLVGVVHGRSSWARVGIDAHLGGYIDPGFEGQITLELSNQTQTPVKLRVGERFCQIAFHKLGEPASNPYDGKYQGDTGARGTRLDEDNDAILTVNTFLN